MTIMNSIIMNNITQYNQSNPNNLNNLNNLNNSNNLNILNTSFEHIYLVNLKRREDRLKIMKIKLEKMRIDYEIFPAIDGHLPQYDNLTKMLMNRRGSYIKNKGAVGLILTYMFLLKDAIDKNYSSILILEDDCNFHKEFNQLFTKKITDKVIDLNLNDVIYLGANQFRYDEDQLKLINNNQDYMMSTKKWFYTFGTYAISMNNKFINILFKSINLETIVYPIDLTIFWTIKINMLKAKILYPFLILPDVTDSDNCGERDQKDFSLNRKYNLDDYDYVSILKINKFLSNNGKIISWRQRFFQKYPEISDCIPVEDFKNIVGNIEGSDEIIKLLKNNVNQIILKDFFKFIETSSGLLNAFVFIVPSFNNKDNYEMNLQSIFSQSYKNFRLIYIDDMSTDNTYELVEKYLSDQSDQSDQSLIFKQFKRQRQGASRYIASHMCYDDEILVFLDGDDWLYNCDVLDNLNTFYNLNNLLMSYGSYYVYDQDCTVAGKKMNFPYHRLIGTRQFPQNIILEKKYREYDWISCHLRTVRAGVFKNIHLEDMLINGSFTLLASDLLEMIPCLEMCGDRHSNIKIPTLVYNKVNSINYDTSYYNNKNQEINKYRSNVHSFVKKRRVYDSYDTDAEYVINDNVSNVELKISYLNMTKAFAFIDNPEIIDYFNNNRSNNYCCGDECCLTLIKNNQHLDSVIMFRQISLISDLSINPSINPSIDLPIDEISKEFIKNIRGIYDKKKLISKSFVILYFKNYNN